MAATKPEIAKLKEEVEAVKNEPVKVSKVESVKPVPKIVTNALKVEANLQEVPGFLGPNGVLTRDGTLMVFNELKASWHPAETGSYVVRRSHERPVSAASLLPEGSVTTVTEFVIVDAAAFEVE